MTNITRTKMNIKMKLLKNKYILSSLLISVLASCNLTKDNVNPNNATDAPISAILTGAEASLGFSLGADIFPISGIFVQQFAGVNGDAAAYENYTEGPARYDQVWNDAYANSLKNLSIAIQKGKASNSPYYTGISRILYVYGFGTLTDVFGDVPFSEALQGASIKTPVYDKQQNIYLSLQALLDSAIVDLNRPTNSFTTPVPGTDDVIFGGNKTKWIAAAWTLKARYALHLSKVDSVAAAANALAYVANGIALNANDAQINFGSATTNSNPFYQISTFRSGWVGLDAAFVNLLNGNQTTDPGTKAENKTNIDPRRSYFATISASGNYKGFRLGESGNASYIGSFFASPTSPIILTSFVENKFIEAEARLRLNPSDPAIKTALSDAITASFDKVVSNTADTNATPAKRAAYISKVLNALNGDFQNDLKVIITQKYVALFTQEEVWVDYRRTGYPVLLSPQGGNNSGNPGGGIPRRFLYPSSEQIQNPNIPTLSATHQTPRLWWDK